MRELLEAKTLHASRAQHVRAFYEVGLLPAAALRGLLLEAMAGEPCTAPSSRGSAADQERCVPLPDLNA